jgi:hypothetical protein
MDFDKLFGTWVEYSDYKEARDEKLGQESKKADVADKKAD